MVNAEGAGKSETSTRRPLREHPLALPTLEARRDRFARVAEPHCWIATCKSVSANLSRLEWHSHGTSTDMMPEPRRPNEWPDAVRPEVLSESTQLDALFAAIVGAQEDAPTSAANAPAAPAPIAGTSASLEDKRETAPTLSADELALEFPSEDSLESTTVEEPGSSSANAQADAFSHRSVLRDRFHFPAEISRPAPAWHDASQSPVDPVASRVNGEKRSAAGGRGERLLVLEWDTWRAPSERTRGDAVAGDSAAGAARPLKSWRSLGVPLLVIALGALLVIGAILTLKAISRAAKAPAEAPIMRPTQPSPPAHAQANTSRNERATVPAVTRSSSPSTTVDRAPQVGAAQPSANHIRKPIVRRRHWVRKTDEPT